MDKLKERGVKGLRFLERYTKTDMVYLTGGGFWLGIGQFVSSGAAFLTSLAFANLLAPETYGLYKYILSINNLLIITTLTGMDSALTQAISRGYDGTFLPTVKEKSKWGLIGSLLALITGAYYFFQGNMILAISMGVVALFIPFSESSDMYNSVLFGKKLFKTQSIYNNIRKVIALVAIVATLFLTKNIYIILFVSLASVLLPSLYFAYKTEKYHKSNNKVDEHAIPYGKHLSAIYIIGLVLAELDKILVFHYVGAADLAIYTLAMAPNDQIKGLLKNVNSLAMPQFSQKSVVEIKKSIWSKAKVLFIGVTLIVAAYILLAGLFFSLFFPKYLASIHYSQVLSISLIPVVISGFLYTVLEAKKATKELYKYNLYSNAVNLIILFPLIYYFGIWGAVISRLITRIFGLGLSTILVEKLV